MTTKRFIIDEYFEIGSVVIDTENENVRFKHENKLSMKQCCDLLNELHEERNYFERKKCEYWNKFNLAHLDNIKLRKENEQLKEKNEELLAKLKYTCEKINYSERLMEMMK